MTHTHTTEELREEFLNIGYWIGPSIDKDLIPEDVMNKIADHWLSKLDQTRRSHSESIISMLEEMKDTDESIETQQENELLDAAISRIRERESDNKTKI